MLLLETIVIIYLSYYFYYMHRSFITLFRFIFSIVIFFVRKNQLKNINNLTDYNNWIEKYVSL